MTQRSNLTTFAIGSGIIMAGATAYAAYNYVKNVHTQEEDSGHNNDKVLEALLIASPKKQSEQRQSSSIGSTKSSHRNSGKKRSRESTIMEHKEIGNSLFKVGKYREAIEEYSLAIEHCPASGRADEAVFFQNRAAAYGRLGELDSCIGDCTAAIERNKKYTKAYHRRATAWQQKSEYRNALYDFTACCILENFKNEDTMAKADQCLRSLGQKSANSIMQKRIPRCLPTEIQCSKRQITGFLTSFVNDPVFSRPQLAYCLKSSLNAKNHGRSRASVPYFSQQSQYDEKPESSPVIETIQKLKYETVIEECSQAISDPESSDYVKLESLFVRGTFHLLVGNAWLAQDDFDGVLSQVARKDIIDAIHDPRKEVSAESIRANSRYVSNVFSITEKWSKAEKDLIKAGQLEPDFPLAKINRCYVNYKDAINRESLSDVTSAIVRLESVVRDYPEESDGLVILGQIYADQRNWTEALEVYEQAIKLDPTNANIYVQKALLILHRDENKSLEAEKLIRKALEIDTNCQAAYETLATVLAQKGKETDAIAYYEQAIGLARTEGEVVHLVCLKEACTAQVEVGRRLGIQIPPPPSPLTTNS